MFQNCFPLYICTPSSNKSLSPFLLWQLPNKMMHPYLLTTVTSKAGKIAEILKKIGF